MAYRRRNDKSINYMKVKMNSLLGRPRQRWHNHVYRYLKLISVENPVQIAKNRKR